MARLIFHQARRRDSGQCSLSPDATQPVLPEHLPTPAASPIAQYPVSPAISEAEPVE
jgi:hypothetical protein